MAIRKNDQLWGLVACHSREARPIEPEGREAAAAITRTAAQRLFALQARKAQQWYEQVRALATSVMEDTARRDDAGDVLQHHGASLCDLFATSGAALLADERIDAYGRVPPDETLHALRAGLVAQGPPSVRAIDAHDAMPAPLAIDTAAGLLAAPLGPSIDNDWLLLFRPEQRRTVAWAGTPHKPYVVA